MKRYVKKIKTVEAPTSDSYPVSVSLPFQVM